MDDKIIGRGTWYDKMAARIVKREQRLGRHLDLIRTEMGVAASGFPHIGNLGDASRAFAVTLALTEQGYASELIAFSDDKDGLRKVPAGLPDSLEEYLGVPVTDIPDPFGCHESYGEHMTLLLLEALDECGIEYEFRSGTDVYEKGLFNEEIRSVLLNAQKVGKIVREEIGQEKFVEALPYFAVCANCGRIYTTRAYEFRKEEDKVLYECEGMEVKGRWLEGCSHKGEVGLTEGKGKLAWKPEFAVRWKALDIRFEAYGKDIADSVRVNDRICREIFGWEPPMHARYELFLDKSGKMLSKSTGVVFTPQTWFKYGSPQSLMLLMLKRFIGTRTLGVSDIPSYMNELDHLEDVFFGIESVVDERERAKLKGLYAYCWALNPPDEPRAHVPYNLLAFLVKMAPVGHIEDFVLEKLQAYGYLRNGQDLSKDLRERVQYASNWVTDFEEIKETKVSLSETEKEAIKELVEALRVEDEAERIQNAVFNVAKNHDIKPAKFFRKLYMVLVGVPRGPRMGPYVLAMGRKSVIDALLKALEKN